MYELDRGWRKRLGVPRVDALPRLEPGARLDSGQWARNEFGGAVLGDKRRTELLVRAKHDRKLVGGEPVTLSEVHLPETDLPAGEKAVQWRLLTSLPVDSVEVAEEVVGHYVQRWRVEDCFRVLKSGCGAQRAAFRTALRLQRHIAIQSVIAWRLTLLGRQVPELAFWATTRASTAWMHRTASGRPCAWWRTSRGTEAGSTIARRVTRRSGKATAS